MSFSGIGPQFFCGLIIIQCFSMAQGSSIGVSKTKNMENKWAISLPCDTFAISSQPLILGKFNSQLSMFT